MQHRQWEKKLHGVRNIEIAELERRESFLIKDEA